MKVNNTRLKRSVSRKVNKAIALATKREKTANNCAGSCLNGNFRVSFCRG